MLIDDGLLMSIINELDNGVYILDPERRITHWNRSAERITGYRADEVVGRQCHDNLLNHIDMEGNLLCLAGCPMCETLCDGEQRCAEVLLRHKDGHRVAVQIKSVPVVVAGRIDAAIEIFTQLYSVSGRGDLLMYCLKKNDRYIDQSGQSQLSATLPGT